MKSIFMYIYIYSLWYLHLLIWAPRGAARGGPATGSQPRRQGLGGLRLSRAEPRGPVTRLWLEILLLYTIVQYLLLIIIYQYLSYDCIWWCFPFFFHKAQNLASCKFSSVLGVKPPVSKLMWSRPKRAASGFWEFICMSEYVRYLNGNKW